MYSPLDTGMSIHNSSSSGMRYTSALLSCHPRLVPSLPLLLLLLLFLFSKKSFELNWFLPSDNDVSVLCRMQFTRSRAQPVLQGRTKKRMSEKKQTNKKKKKTNLGLKRLFPSLVRFIRLRQFENLEQATTRGVWRVQKLRTEFLPLKL